MAGGNKLDFLPSASNPVKSQRALAKINKQYMKYQPNKATNIADVFENGPLWVLQASHQAWSCSTWSAGSL